MEADAFWEAQMHGGGTSGWGHPNRQPGLGHSGAWPACGEGLQGWRRRIVPGLLTKYRHADVYQLAAPGKLMRNLQRSERVQTSVAYFLPHILQ
jgi:hypothetical protein